MLKYHKPDTAPPPFSNYSPGVEVPAGARWYLISGQVGADTDGNTSKDEREQHEQTWRNVLALLKSAGMGPEDIVRIKGYVTSPSGVPIYREVRDQFIGDARPASTLLVISGLASPDWLVEIEVIAAKA